MAVQALNLIRITFPVGPLQANCTLVADANTREAVVIDPGGDPEQILAQLAQHALKAVAIVHTHAHLDHVMGAGALRESTQAPVYVPEADRFLWEAVEMQCRTFGMRYTPVPEVDIWLQDGDKLPCGGVALHTPGHSPGSMCFWFADANLVVVGDTLFRRGIGRTDLWGGDYAALEQSVRHKLYSLGEQVTVVTGHGPDTCLGDEMRENPYIRM